jgi:hypothetical protein
MLSPNGTTPQVDQATHTEASGDFPQLRATGREETAQQPIPAKLLDLKLNPDTPQTRRSAQERIEAPRVEELVDCSDRTSSWELNRCLESPGVWNPGGNSSNSQRPKEFPSGIPVAACTGVIGRLF